MPTMTITVTMLTDDELDDSMGLLEQQVSEALGFLGDVQTCDISLDDGETSLDDALSLMLEDDDEDEDNDDIEWED